MAPSRNHGRWCVLRYGEPQVTIAIVFGVLAVTIAVVALVVAVHAKDDVPVDDVSRTAYRLRRPWLAFLSGLLVVAVGFSFFLLPYASGGESLTVAVSGGQFYWTIDPAVLPAHRKVRFDVSSVDVNHGFGVYDPDGRLIGSVQAMPGYTNELELTFDTPGEYRIRCFEYCGLSHHNMTASFRVEER
jgi:cytochrome c oxidase subunit 2